MLHCAGFISADSLYIFRASSAHHQVYLKLARCPLVRVLWLQVGHHITILGTKFRFVLNTPDDGRLTPEKCRVSLQK